MEAVHGNLTGGKGSQEQTEESETLPLLGVSQKHQTNGRNIDADVQIHGSSKLYASLTMSPVSPMILIQKAMFSWGLPSPLTLQSFLTLCQGVPCSPWEKTQYRLCVSLCIMSGYGSLCTFPSVVRGSLSDGDRTVHQSEYRRVPLRIISLIFFKDQSCLVQP